MEVLIVVLLLAIFLALCGILVVASQLRDKAGSLTDEVKDLRLTSRTRVRQASMQSGAETREQELTKLGRLSIGRRVVVGGDDDSQLTAQLKRGSGIHDDDRQ